MNWIYYRKQLLFNETSKICFCLQLINKKILDASNAKECYQSFLKNKNKKLVIQSKIVTQQPNIMT